MGFESQISDLREELKRMNGKLNTIVKTLDSQQRNFEERIKQVIENFHEVISQ